jgi:hypothetical protein
VQTNVLPGDRNDGRDADGRDRDGSDTEDRLLLKLLKENKEA